MIHQSFYRAYRPQTFGDMSGQALVKQTLQNALLHNRTTHAYLFSGPRGTGKTTTAKVFAKALNCERGPAPEPCNECATCVSITEGSNTDVIEFDAASNSRVEEMREIIGKVHVAPARSPYKVYIIDEVHMLSNSAFNALLKTLEEPPSHVVFILATTEPHKIPLTIISRCQRFDFKPLTNEEIIDRLSVVLNDIGVTAEKGALQVIAQAASGGMRDALSMLDQVVAFSSDTITVDAALLVTGSISEERFYELTDALVSNDPKRALSIIDELMQEGKDELRLVEDSITLFRDFLLLKTANDSGHLLQMIQEPATFQSVIERFTVEQLYACIDVFAQAQQEMRFSNYARVYIESALLKIIHMMSVAPVATAEAPVAENVQQQLDDLRKTVSDLRQLVANRPAPAKQAKQPSRAPQQKPVIRVPKAKVEGVLAEATKQDLVQLRSLWANLMQALTKSHAALLEETEPVAASSSAFVLKFNYDIHCSIALEKEMLRDELLRTLQQFLQKPYDVIYVPEEQWQKIRSEFIATKMNRSEEVEEQREEAFEMHDVADEQEHIVQATELFGDIVTVVDE